MFYIRVVHLIEEILDSLIVFVVVHNDEAYLRCGDEGRDKPLIKSIYGLKLHVRCLPFVLIHQIEGSMSYKLAEMPVILLLCGSRNTVQLRNLCPPLSLFLFAILTRSSLFTVLNSFSYMGLSL